MKLHFRFSNSLLLLLEILTPERQCLQMEKVMLPKTGIHQNVMIRSSMQQNEFSELA